AAYYIWKNYKKEDIPYWGLCHYRRYFILHFNPLLPYKKVYFMEANEESFQKIFRPKLEATIKQKLDEGYIILSKPYYMWKLKKWSVKQHYAKYHHIESWNLMEDALAKLHPEYMDAFHEFGSGLSMSLYNMLIASYDFWDGYLGWVFSILFEVQKHYTIPTDANQRRVFGFLSERLLNVYALHHHKKNGLKIHYMPVAHLG
ncbi:MAG: DUF4422 domain-containing protein, partial [Bacteroidetes bacterium]|nr:DUF4422 domain-containing protein [Bacteroidota bacterium]